MLAWGHVVASVFTGSWSVVHLQWYCVEPRVCEAALATPLDPPPPLLTPLQHARALVPSATFLTTRAGRAWPGAELPAAVGGGVPPCQPPQGFLYLATYLFNESGNL